MKLIKRNLLNFTKLFLYSILALYVYALKTKTSISSGAKKVNSGTEAQATVFEFLQNLHKEPEAAPADKATPAAAAPAAPGATPPLPPALASLDPNSLNNTSSYIIDLNDPNVPVADWLSISSEAFNNHNKYPALKGSEGNDMAIKFGIESQRYNEKNKVAVGEGSLNEYNFWFKIRGGYIYYFATKDDINIIGSVLVKSVENSAHQNRNTNGTDSCFNVWDYSDDRYRICAMTKEIKFKWMCSLQKFLKMLVDPQCFPNNKMGPFGFDGKTLVEIKKIMQPVIIIPTASRQCNEKFDYMAKGANWECICKEGREQSPIDLPAKDAAVLSEMKPMFQYELVMATSTENTVDGTMEAEKNIMIKNERGALRILHANMGKIVQLDGGVYVAEEIVFHTPSEHKINGVHADMEMQVIHYGRSVGDIAKQIILSFLFKAKPGVYNKFIDKLDFFNLPNPIDQYRMITQNFFIPSIFYTTEDDDVPSMKPFSFYTYEGSLTAPPCTERTTHYVATDPIELSSTVVSLFKEALRSPDLTTEKGDFILVNAEGDLSNNREIQPINGRAVFVYDHVHFNCPEFKKTRRNIAREGHYEKREINTTRYVFVTGENPSGIPDSFVVSEAEAKGSDDAIVGDEDHNDKKFEAQP
jgi:carbonic anhydrase